MHVLSLYFADKRQVLFKGSGRLQEAMLAALNRTPSTVSVIDAIAITLTAAGEVFDDDRRLFARRRSKVIAANAVLTRWMRTSQPRRASPSSGLRLHNGLASPSNAAMVIS
ncbi:hypothetical protein ACRS85_00800 [Pluralibacter gergoviae]|uniref:hypothetical protein n=1 Tax=Enterobacteriaceae TaxID=543 RepID=UPI002361A714|nr:hypothetical protein [Klebsiella variicola]